MFDNGGYQRDSAAELRVDPPKALDISAELRDDPKEFDNGGYQRDTEAELRDDSSKALGIKAELRVGPKAFDKGGYPRNIMVGRKGARAKLDAFLTELEHACGADPVNFDKEAEEWYRRLDVLVNAADAEAAMDGRGRWGCGTAVDGAGTVEEAPDYLSRIHI